MRSTILDIARLAGVSRTTVSNVMNGNPKCTQDTIDRVLRIAGELEYRPNFAARSLVNKRSNMVGLILPSYVDRHFLTKSPFFSLTVDAINAALRDRSSYDLLINCVHPGNDPSEVVEWALQRNLAGLIFVGDFDETALTALDEAQIPLVFIDNYSPGRSSGILINTDNVQGAFLAVRHLVDRGCRRIACCSSNTARSAVNFQRYQGYQKALAEAGLPELLIDSEGIFFESGVALSERLQDERVDGAFAVADTLALGLIKGLALRGLRVPQDVKVVGFDNLEASAQSMPELTTVDQAIYQKGSLAVEHLSRAIGREPRSQTVMLPVSLVVRQSS